MAPVWGFREKTTNRVSAKQPGGFPGPGGEARKARQRERVWGEGKNWKGLWWATKVLRAKALEKRREKSRAGAGESTLLLVPKELGGGWSQGEWGRENLKRKQKQKNGARGTWDQHEGGGGDLGVGTVGAILGVPRQGLGSRGTH